MRKLGTKHAGLGIQRIHFDIVKRALLETLTIMLGEMFTEEVNMAWSSAYDYVAAVMMFAMPECST